MKHLRQINLNSLRIVESAARLGSFARAAEENLISGSAVSQRVKALEEQLQFKVFHRQSNAVVLTPEGEEFIAHVREALDTILAAGLEITDKQRKHLFKISVLPTFAVRWLLPRLERFTQAHPEITLHVSQAYRQVNFDREGFDLAIRYGDGVFPGLKAELLFREDLVPVCTPDLLERVMPGVKTDELEPKDLKNFTLLHSDTCSLNWKSWLDFAGAPKVMEHASCMFFDTCMLSFQAANVGLGFAVANRPYVTEDIRAGRLVAPFKLQHPNNSGWYLVYPPGHSDLYKISAFESWIRKEVESSNAEVSELFYGEFDGR
ncbi:LysR substrate-binding domain-containing protein [Algihabitans sp.]|uniref:LysR substrate-binding domain-containing protein n=1 Tax=Algihabitans sp. TaxID=2821514 RepID=UPI003BAA8B92